MDWGAQHKLRYTALIGGIIAVIVFFSVVLPILQKPATCDDGRNNGDEIGIDCGGSCALVCKETASDILVRWTQALPVSSTSFVAVAYLENQNTDAAATAVPYRFFLRDAENRLIASIRGETFIVPRGITAVIELNIPGSLNRPVARTTFEILQEPIWITVDEVTQDTFSVTVRDIRLDESGIRPRLTARLISRSLYELRDFEVSAILYDADKNAVTAGKTFVERLPAGGETSLVFTWPNKFDRPVVDSEIIPLFNMLASLAEE